jgi:hypothetical protein
VGVEYIEVVNNDEDGSAELNACVSQHLVVRARREPSASLPMEFRAHSVQNEAQDYGRLALA